MFDEVMFMGIKEYQLMVFVAALILLLLIVRRR